ncbi:MAG TPA: tetratricopeptide repeat protein, partial [Acidimicrobiales bacterium]|nr:tetratricopeptide repeat protein [Acidimicrobiales bacterium]
MALRDYLTGEPNEGEHRLSAVAFVAFTGTDGLIRSEGVQAASVALDELVTTVQEACVRWGVTFLSTDVNRDGGKMILVAGVPNASRDAEEQVLRAVLDVLGTPRRLPVRAGVNRGRIFAVDLGGRERRTYTVIGDAVNLAARVAFKAEAGQLVATEAVVERTRNAFVLDELEPFMVKGKSEPIRAYLVKQGHGTRPEAAPQALRLIGRAREIAVLRDALAGAHEGVGRIVELVGEPGIGKSRLLAETSRLAHGLAQVAFEGGQYAQGTPYFAVRAPLRGLIGVAAESAVADVEHTLSVTVDRLVPHLAPWLPLIGIAFGLELADTPTTSRINPAFRRIKLNAVTVEFLEALLVEPTLLTIEDAHWLDGGSADLFAMLLQGAGRRPWAVVVTRREVADGFKAPDELATTLPIEPLDVAGSMTMAEAVADDHPLPSYVLADLAARSAGNPLFLQELLAAAQLGPMAELPDTVEAIMASTIDTLDPADRRTLRSAAVLGSRFTVNELIAMLADESSAPGPSEQATVTMPALARLGHFLIPEGPDRLRFRHVLLREVAYEGLAYRSRRQLHGRAGEFIERASGSRADEAAELLALHFHAARRFDRSWHYSRLAAARARRNAALAEAVIFLQRALEAARALRNVPEAEVAEVCEELGDVCELSGRYAEAADAYARSRRRRRSDPVALAYLCRKDGRVRERSTRYSAALRWYTRGFTHLDAAMARGTDERVLSTARARLTLSRGSALVQQGRYREGVPLLKEVVRLASELHEQSMLGHACYMLDWALTDTGSPERHRYRQLVIDIYRQLDADDRKGTALMNLGAHVYYEGQWNEAIAYYREAQVCQERGGDLIGRAMTINNTAEILCDQGHLEEAKGLFRETLRVVRAAPFTIGIGFALANLGLVAIRSGEFGEAAELLAAARPLFESAGAMDMVLFTETKEV